MRGERALGPGRLWKRGSKWVLDYRDELGKRRRQALSTDRRAAERIRADVIRRRDMAIAGLGREEGMSLPLSEVVAAYLADLEPRVGPLHYKLVRRRLERTLPRLRVERVRDLEPMHVVRVRSEVLAEGSGRRTANLYVSTLQAALRWAVENEIIGRSPVEHVKALPEREEHRKHQRRAMGEEEIADFLAASEADDEENDLRAALEGWQRVPQTPLWLALLETGARWNELRTATWGDVRLQDRLLSLRATNTKSRKQRVLPLRRELVERLRELRVLHETVLGRLPTVRDLVFLTPEGCPWPRPTNNVMRIFHRLLERAGIARVDERNGKLDLHALRHTAASRMARQGVPLVQAQKILGHSDPKLTAAVYTHIDAEDLRGAIESLPALRPRAEPRKEAR